MVTVNLTPLYLRTVEEVSPLAWMLIVTKCNHISIISLCIVCKI